MWFIQTPVDALAIPTDSVGHTALTGSVSVWHHLVRDNSFGTDERALISNTPLKWSIRAWQQMGRRVQLHDAIAAHEPLAEMVQAEPMRAYILALFPKTGKRQADNTIELIVVVPPEQFARYESLVQFAMTLPSGHLSITVPSPIVARQTDATDTDRTLIGPDSYALLEGMGMTVARGKAQTLSKTELRGERRTVPVVQPPANILHDDGDDWLLFAAAPKEGTPALEDSIKE